MHRRESAKRTVAASPQGSLIVILKDNMKSTWQFRQFKAEAKQTVRKVEQTDMRLHRATFACPPLPEHHTSVHCWVGLHSAMQDFTSTHSLIFTHTQNPAVHSLSTHTPPAAARPPTQLDTQVCWHIQTETLSTLTPAQVRSQHQLPGHRRGDLALIEGLYLLTIS